MLKELEKFLSTLGASTKITIGVSVSPNIGLEMIEVDKSSGIVTRYGCKPLSYNSSTREIADYDEFRSALEMLFEELEIPKRSNIALSLPNVHFGLIYLPVLLTDEAITNAIISEVEQSYIFKRHEPEISWVDMPTATTTDNRPIVYTAIQKQAVDQILDICSEIGCTLTCVENSYTSLFRALNYVDIAKEQTKENISWNLMTIMQNNYSIISMNGKKVLDYYEEPLALKSFVDDEIYNAIKTSAQLTLAGLPANYLFIISETDLVSAEILSMKLPFDGSVSFLECNKFVQKEIMPVSLNILQKEAALITPEAIGTAIYTTVESPLKLNMLNLQNDAFSSVVGLQESPKINIGNLEIELTPSFIKKISLIVASVTIVPLIIAYFTLTNSTIPQKNAELDGINANITKLNSDIALHQESSKGPSFDVFEVTNKIVTQNKLKLTYYNALGISIPPKLWVSSYATNTEGKINLKGSSNNVKSIYTFYKNLKQMVNGSDITLKKLEIASNSIDAAIQDSSSNKTYEFEITNMSDTSALSAPTTTGNSTSGATPGTQSPQPIFFFGKKDTTQTEGAANQPIPPTPEQNQPMPPTPNNGGLPNNLKKIEKF